MWNHRFCNKEVEYNRLMAQVGIYKLFYIQFH